MWGQLVIDSLLRPRAAARRILGMPLSALSLVEAAVLVSCGGTLVIYLAAHEVPALAGGEFGDLTGSPFLATVLNVVQIVAIAAAAVWVGRRFGGTGELSGAVALVVWYNFVSMILVAALLGAYLLAPLLALVLGLAFCFWLVWAPVSFVAELHGFANALVVLAGLLLTMLALFLAMNVVAMLVASAFREFG
jgi:Yip1-like protein